MVFRERIFRSFPRDAVTFGVADIAVLLLIAVVIYLGAQMALGTPAVIQGPEINLDPAALPFYALPSIGRMLAAYLLSLTFSLLHGYTAARSKSAQRWLIPLLDITPKLWKKLTRSF